MKSCALSAFISNFAPFFCVEVRWWAGAAASLYRSEEVAEREGIFYRKRRLLSLVFDDSNFEHLNPVSLNKSKVDATCMIMYGRIAFRSVARLCRNVCASPFAYSYGVGFYVLARSTLGASSKA